MLFTRTILLEIFINLVVNSWLHKLLSDVLQIALLYANTVDFAYNDFGYNDN